MVDTPAAFLEVDLLTRATVADVAAEIKQVLNKWHASLYTTPSDKMEENGTDQLKWTPCGERHSRYPHNSPNSDRKHTQAHISFLPGDYRNTLHFIKLR